MRTICAQALPHAAASEALFRVYLDALLRILNGNVSHA